MLRLSLLMKLGSISSIDEMLLDNRKKHLNSLNDKELEKFVRWYLSRECSSDKRYRDSIFFYLDEAASRMGKEELEDLAILSKYFETKPEEDIYHYFKVGSFYNLSFLKDMKNLRDYLSRKITKTFKLINLINEGADIDIDYAIKKMVDVGNIDYLLKCDSLLYRLRGNLAMEMVNSKLYSLEDMKDYFSKTGIGYSAKAMLYNFSRFYENTEELEEKDSILELLISIVSGNQKRLDDKKVFDSRTGKPIDGYTEFAKYIANAKNISIEMKNRLAMKMLEAKSYSFIYEWFIHDVDCEYNYKLIEGLVLENVEVVERLFTCIDIKYFNYAVMKFFDRIQSFKGKEFNADRVLDVIYSRNNEFRLPREVAINLINSGSKYAYKFITDYNFSDNEREVILDNNKSDECFLGVYEDYLISGDRDYLWSYDDAQELLDELRLERRNK